MFLFIDMLGTLSQLSGAMWYQEAVSFTEIHHELGGGALLLFLCWNFSICTGGATCALCTTINEYIVIVYRIVMKNKSSE